MEAPKLVDKTAVQIGYAKTAKKVDMKRIKAVTWSILIQASTEVNIRTFLLLFLGMNKNAVRYFVFLN